MTDITIPPEALEAVAQYLWAERYPHLPWSDANSSARIEFRVKARAACLAMLRAWPGTEYVFRQPHRRAVSYSNPAIILPLPTENSNAEG